MKKILLASTAALTLSGAAMAELRADLGLVYDYTEDTNLDDDYTRQSTYLWGSVHNDVGAFTLGGDIRLESTDLDADFAGGGSADVGINGFALNVKALYNVDELFYMGGYLGYESIEDKDNSSLNDDAARYGVIVGMDYREVGLRGTLGGLGNDNFDAIEFGFRSVLHLGRGIDAFAEYNRTIYDDGVDANLMLGFEYYVFENFSFDTSYVNRVNDFDGSEKEIFQGIRLGWTYHFNSDHSTPVKYKPITNPVSF